MRILFLGEGEIAGPARYLSAILRGSKIPFDHQPDRMKLPTQWRKRRYNAVVLSDYRYGAWTSDARRWLIDQVTVRGTGLLMIGGFASFTGRVGGYAGTDLGHLLPVDCIPGDDRVTRPTGTLLCPAEKHSLLRGLSWNRPPVLCGYHRVRLKPHTQVVLSFRDLVKRKSGVRLAPPQPALVLGHIGNTRTGAFLSDCAPHWAGGFVDWGNKRTSVQLGPRLSVEVGNHYFHFFQQLLQWIGQI